MKLNLTEEEMRIRKLKQRNDAQKRYYQKNKEKYKLYNQKRNFHYKQLNNMALDFMEKNLGYVQNGKFQAFGDLDYAQEEIEKLYKILKGDSNE